MSSAKKSNKTHIFARYGLIVVIALLFSAIVIIKLFTTTIIEAPAWNQRAKKDFSKEDTIAPQRGNLLSDNGNILACNLTVYDIRVDLRHNEVQKMRTVPWPAIDSLADSLDRYFPLRADLAEIPARDSEHSWHTRLEREMRKPPHKRPRALRLVRKGTLADFEMIKKFPFFNRFKKRGSRNPVYTEARDVRIYPYGRMAYRSIGRVNEDSVTGEIHGFSGIEKDLDSLLYGVAGRAKKVALTNGIGNWVSRPAVPGYDVHTTIDIDLQDMLEEELTKICIDNNAEWGTALLIEVATGEIKAIANVEDLHNGTYGEALNRAVRGFEPGSVMKPISLMIAFEDGLVKSVNDVVDCSPFQRTSDPHAPSVKTMKQVIEMSSNTGISRVIFRGYSQDPSKFRARLEQIGFFDDLQSGISGTERPYFSSLPDHDRRGNRITMTARHLDLARQAYGYASTIPPIYTLAYYNAIANKGVFVRPHIMRGLTGHGIDTIFPIEGMKRRICSEATAEKVKICLKEPVWGAHGTARMVKDERVVIAGKTGTAYPVPDKGGAYDHSKRRYAFAGFFPYDNPKYSCMALILTSAGNSANRTSGQVVKNVALKMYARGMLDNVSVFNQRRLPGVPLLTDFAAANRAQLARLLRLDGLRTFTTPAPQAPGTVPDVSGMDAASALRILETAGLNVRISGAGYVTAQSPAAGTPLKRGNSITLQLQP